MPLLILGGLVILNSHAPLSYVFDIITGHKKIDLSLPFRAKRVGIAYASGHPDGLILSPNFLHVSVRNFNLIQNADFIPWADAHWSAEFLDSRLGWVRTRVNPCIDAIFYRVSGRCPGIVKDTLARRFVAFNRFHIAPGEDISTQPGARSLGLVSCDQNQPARDERQQDRGKGGERSVVLIDGSSLASQNQWEGPTHKIEISALALTFLAAVIGYAVLIRR